MKMNPMGFLLIPESGAAREPCVPTFTGFEIPDFFERQCTAGMRQDSRHLAARNIARASVPGLCIGIPTIQLARLPVS